jgi:hypothetical protein
MRTTNRGPVGPNSMQKRKPELDLGRRKEIKINRIYLFIYLFIVVWGLNPGPATC